MKAFIFCGGFGTRMKSHDSITPKPLIKIKNVEIIKYIIDILEKNNVRNINLLCGYKIDKFLDFKRKFEKKNKNKIELNILNTGYYSNTYERIRRIKKLLKNEELFLITYGDSIANFDLNKSLKNFKKKDIANILVFQKKGTVGTVSLSINKITSFQEKGIININAGFYLFSNKILNYFNKKNKSLEMDILPKIAKQNKISYTLTKFWQPIDNKKNINEFKKILNAKNKNNN